MSGGGDETGIARGGGVFVKHHMTLFGAGGIRPMARPAHGVVVELGRNNSSQSQRGDTPRPGYLIRSTIITR